MAGPDHKENQESVLGKAVQMPRPDQSAIISSEGAVQLPARPASIDSQIKSEDKHVSQSKADSDPSKDSAELKKELLQMRIQDLEVLVARSEQERKALLSAIFLGQNPDKEILSLAESLINLSGNARLIDQVITGSITQEDLAKHLLSYIQQQRSFDCTAKELAMLDALEFQIMRVLQHINPNIRNQQQQQIQEELNTDDDAGSSGPEKAEDERESAVEGIEDADPDTDTSYSPRSKKGKARARSKGRDRRSRFRKWLDRMMRAFRRQSVAMRTTALPRAARAAEVRDRRFISTVRIFGKVLDSKNNLGLQGVKIVSNSLGTVVTGKDGSFAFENVAIGTSYSLAPIMSGFNFSPSSVSDVALDYREYVFLAEPA